MDLNLEPELERRLEERARAAGACDTAAYVRALVEEDLAREHAAWQRELAGRLRLRPDELHALRSELAEGAARWAERDREIAEEWLTLEEELYERDPPRGSGDGGTAAPR